MSRQRIATRLHVEENLQEGQSVGLDHGRAHFLRDVLRLSRGAYVALFNGRDGEWLARIDGLGKGWCSLSVETCRRPPRAEADLWLLFAPIKRARIDFLVEKATELGCSRLQPVMTRYTDVSRVNVARLAANAREAAEQCERLTLPEVCDPQTLESVMAAWPTDRRLLLCAERGPVKAIGEQLQELRGESGGYAVLTGPEGGFAPGEIERLTALPFVLPVGLGPRVLRADTAALAALACFQALLGDGGERPSARTAVAPADGS